jgi:hypothetical protein
MRDSINQLSRYLAGDLSLDEARVQLGSGGQGKGKDVLDLIELDHRCRQVLSRIASPSGAAERLSQLVSDVGSYVEVETTQKARPPSRIAINAPEFDVFGAQYTPKKDKDEAKHDDSSAEQEKSKGQGEESAE